jgi:hypothetical protein
MQWIRSRSSLIGRSRDHLRAVGESYFQHMRFAATVGALMVLAGLACILHGLVPGIFTDRASRTIRHLHTVIEKRSKVVVPIGQDGEVSGLIILFFLSLLTLLLPWLIQAPALIALALSLLSLALILAALHAAAEPA